MSDEKQRPGQRPTAEELRELLQRRRPLNLHDDFYNHPLCPCEETKPENQSEYDVAGDWVTYEGPINVDIFEHASRNAAQDLEAQMREFYKEPVAPPTSSAQAQAPNDALEARKPKPKKVEQKWPTMETYAVNVNKVASPTAEIRTALLDAAAKGEDKPRHFALISDYPAKNLVYNFYED